MKRWRTLEKIERKKVLAQSSSPFSKEYEGGTCEGETRERASGIYVCASCGKGKRISKVQMKQGYKKRERERAREGRREERR